MEQRNLILAIVLSVLILVTFQILFAERGAPPPEAPAVAAGDAGAPAAPAGPGGLGPAAPNAPAGPAPAVPAGTPGAMLDRDAALAAVDRIDILSPRLRGSLSLTGARIDDLWLRDYRETLAPDSPQVLLLSPAGTPTPYYAEFGWVAAAGSGIAVPTPTTVWTASGGPLAPDAPVTLRWDNGQGLTFVQQVAVDDDFLFTITQRVENSGAAAATLYPYGRIRRTGTPDTLGFFVLHEGPLGVFNGTLKELGYDDLQDLDAGQAITETSSDGGWLGITEKYWLLALVPDQGEPFEAHYRYPDPATEAYQADYLREAVVIAPGAAAEVTNRLFAGAKEVKTVERYRSAFGITRFDLTIDWGWLFFLTKPIFLAIDRLFVLTGNFGIAIIIFTIFVRILFYPLANKSFRSFGAMRKVQPEVTRIREAYKDDRERMTKEMMDLYKREQVNPLSGCLPLVLQIPVFFALYKTLFVTIEMRHAPFYGWIKDLSAPDPTTIFNLFGLIPWDPPSFLYIGIWPLLMGISMFVQQKLNPAPPDPLQARIFMMLPIVFTVILAGFPAGLVIYWTVNNVLSMAQQWVIMRRVEAAPSPSGS